MTRLFAITGLVRGIGKRQHCIRGETHQAAWVRFVRAYPKHECVFISAQPVAGASR